MITLMIIPSKASAAELLNKVKALCSSTKESDIIKRLYEILSALDSKANGLLRINSIFIAIILALSGWLITSTKISASWRPLVYIDLVVFGISSILCLWIVRISWPFLGKVALIKESEGNVKSAAELINESAAQFKNEIEALSEVCTCRTFYYSLAWGLTFLGFGAFGIYAIFEALC